MTFPKSLKSTKTLIKAEIVFLICEVLTILTASVTVSSFRFTEQTGVDLGNTVVYLIYGIALLAVSAKLYSYALYLIASRRASAEDDNFKVAFYSIIITLLIVLFGIIISFNNEVQSIADLLIILTTLLADVYILEGYRSLCKQLGHPEMDKRGGVLYAVITIFFVFQTCASVFILVLGGTMATTGASMLEIFGSVLGIVQSILLLGYFKRTQQILAAE